MDVGVDMKARMLKPEELRRGVRIVSFFQVMVFGWLFLPLLLLLWSWL